MVQGLWRTQEGELGGVHGSFHTSSTPGSLSSPVHLWELFGIKSKQTNEATLPGTLIQSVPGSGAICSTLLLTEGYAAFYFILF